MENPEPPLIRPITQRSTTIRFFRWLFSWRGIRRMLIILAWPVTIIALVYADENWRGRHAWNKERQKLEARGEKLDLKDFIPKAVPDEQNFAATPFIKSWFVRGAQNEQIWGDDFSRIKGNFPSDQVKGRRRFVDLVGWARAFETVRAGEGATKRSAKATPDADL